MERTFIIIKPDAVQRGLIGEIISRYERRGLKIVAMKFEVSDELAQSAMPCIPDALICGIGEIHHQRLC